MNSFQNYFKKGSKEDKEKLLKNEKSDKSSMKPNQYDNKFPMSSSKNIPYNKFKNDKKQ